MVFLLKKARLVLFLTRRIPRFGWGQWMRGMRDRRMSYLAMDMAKLLPGEAQTIVDIGAHTGLMADALEFLYRPARLWAVEPNPAHGAQLQARFRGRPNVAVVECCVGEKEGSVAFNAYEFDAASSLFACKAGHMAALGLSDLKRSIEVRMRTLTDLLPDDLAILDLLKLDCQGAELSVLRGAGSRLGDIRWIFCEVSFEAIYVGAPLWGELHEFLRTAGFELRSLSGLSGSGASVQWGGALYANTRFSAA